MMKQIMNTMFVISNNYLWLFTKIGGRTALYLTAYKPLFFTLQYSSVSSGCIHNKQPTSGKTT